MGAAVATVDEWVPQIKAHVRHCRRYEWSEHLSTTVAAGYGFRVVFRDGRKGPVRKTFREAAADAKTMQAAPPREDVSPDKGTGA